MAVFVALFAGTGVNFSPKGGVFQENKGFTLPQESRMELLDDCGIKNGYEFANNFDKDAGEMYLLVLNVLKECPNVAKVFSSEVSGCDTDFGDKEVFASLIHEVESCKNVDGLGKSMLLDYLYEVQDGKRNPRSAEHIIGTGVVCTCCGTEGWPSCCIGCGIGIIEIIVGEDK